MPKDTKTPRRNAILNAAAVRMGYKSWSEFGTAFTQIILPLEQTEPLENDNQVRDQMLDVLEKAQDHLLENSRGPEDINRILTRYPRKARGGARKKGVGKHGQSDPSAN